MFGVVVVKTPTAKGFWGKVFKPNSEGDLLGSRRSPLSRLHEYGSRGELDALVVDRSYTKEDPSVC